MNKEIYTKKLWSVMMFCLIFMLVYSNVFAWGQDRSYGHGREVVKVGHERYNYHDGRFFRPGWFGFEFAIALPPAGVVVSTLPFGYRTIAVNGMSYYYYQGVYYKHCPLGYIVVPEPVITVAQPQSLPGEKITINVANSNGSYTPVTLVKRNNGYVGPQGEYYPGNPTIDQLKALYGK